LRWYCKSRRTIPVGSESWECSCWIKLFDHAPSIY
jgi:hypothetical protein